MTYVHLGRDAEGRYHTYRTVDETIIVVDGRDRVHREDVRGRSVDEWMAFVEERVGWGREVYGLGLGRLAERAISMEDT